MSSSQDQRAQRDRRNRWLWLVYSPIVTYSLVAPGLMSHDRRIMFLGLAGVFATLAIFAHLKKLHPFVRLAAIAGLIGACLAAWIYGFWTV